VHAGGDDRQPPCGAFLFIARQIVERDIVGLYKLTLSASIRRNSV